MKLSLAVVLVAVACCQESLAGPGYRPTREYDSRSDTESTRQRFDAYDSYDTGRREPAVRRPYRDNSRALPVVRENAWAQDEESEVPLRATRSAPPSRRFHTVDSFGLSADDDMVDTPRSRSRYDQDVVEEPVPAPRRRGSHSPADATSAPQGYDSQSPAWKGHLAPAQDLISRRYQDPRIVTFLAGVNPDQSLSLYAETLQLVAERHLSPPAPAKIVKRGLYNLVEALRNPDFQQVNRLNVSAGQFQQFEQTLVDQFQQSQVTSNEDAVAALRSTMQLAQQTLGLNPAVVGLEFEYGAIESLDQFSAFVPPENSRLNSASLQQEVVGIGVQIELVPQGLRVLRVLPNGPAAKAGLQRDDLVVAIDGQSLAGRDLNSATALITGPEGSPVTITVAKAGGATAAVVVARQRVDVQSVVDVQMLDVQTGYLKLDSFAASSATEMEQALESLAQQGMQSVVVDLRGNGGGLLTTAIDIARLFVKQGTIVSTRGRTPEDNTVETGNSGAAWNVPLALLVDGDSASASEILAAAIQENGRGVVVGHTTYGKGTVQTLFPLKALGASVRLTTAKFYSPTGREMAGVGVHPDIPVDAGRAMNGLNVVDPVVDRAVVAVHSGMPNQPMGPFGGNVTGRVNSGLHARVHSAR
ncbi:MAG: S41 family peptidase [Planctomycetota bacterium]|nr:S41 family peptidase [Planctomycetota bacterium]